jgi:hypothetical protein
MVHRAKLQNTMQPDKRGGFGQRCQFGGKINMSPKDIPYRTGKAFGQNRLYRNSHRTNNIEYCRKMFYNFYKVKKMRIAVFAALFLLGTTGIFPQADLMQRGSIPEELLRPRRDEAPRYPIDMVIGTLGQGKAPQEAYEVARNAAAALLAGNTGASVLSSVSSVYLESWTDILNTINPQIFRLGGGREEPDGSVSFLVRFAGREQGITGELFIRLEERRPPQAAEISPPVNETKLESETESESEGENGTALQPVEEKQVAEPATVPIQAVAPVPDAPVEKAWLFEDLILEEARSRDEENKEADHRFDFSPYQRFF